MTSDSSKLATDLQYLHGFGNEHESEALPGALPVGRFSPQRVSYGLYAEQFNTTAFTAPSAQKRRSCLYRIRPSAVQGDYQPWQQPSVRTAPITEVATPPNMLRWDPVSVPENATDFIDGLVTIAANGDAMVQNGMGIHLYAANRSMQNRYFYCADGELLFIPQMGELLLRTECGKLRLRPG